MISYWDAPINGLYVLRDRYGFLCSRSFNRVLFYPSGNVFPAWSFTLIVLVKIVGCKRPGKRKRSELFKTEESFEAFGKKMGEVPN